VVGVLAAGALSLAAFLAVEARAHNPMLPLSLFRSRTFSGANLLTLFLYTALSGTMFFLPLNLIQVQGYAATSAGAALLPFILIMFLLSRWAGGLVNSHGAKLPLVVGPLVTALGYVGFMFRGLGESYWTSFFPSVVVLGLGMALSVAPLTTTVMNAVGEKRAGTASGVNNAVARAAGLLGVAILGMVISHAFNRELEHRLAGLDLSPETRLSLDQQRVRLAGAELPPGISHEMGKVLRQEINESFVAGFRLIMATAVGLALASALIALVLIPGKARAGIQVP